MKWTTFGSSGWPSALGRPFWGFNIFGCRSVDLAVGVLTLVFVTSAPLESFRVIATSAVWAPRLRGLAQGSSEAQIHES